MTMTPGRSGADGAVRAVTVRPGDPESLSLSEIAAPAAEPGSLLVEGLAVGICGTDHEIIAGAHGAPPDGTDRLVLGHESLGRVVEAPDGSGFEIGDLVAGVVRRPDPVPCRACAAGAFDHCRNGLYTERGIKQRHGFGAQRWAVDPAYAVRLDPRLGSTGVLAEPASVVTKAWAQIDHVGARSWYEPRTVLVTGAGPIGLLAALLGRQRGLDVHVLDRVTTGPKPDLVADLGATYHHGDVDDLARRLQPDIVVEATGAPTLVLRVMTLTGPSGIVCLTGVSASGRIVPVDAGAINREIVLENDVLLGSVSALPRHFADGARALAEADQGWLARLITRTVPLAEFADAFRREPGDVKVVLSLR